MTSPNSPENRDALDEEIVQVPATPGAEALPTSDADSEQTETSP